MTLDQVAAWEWQAGQGPDFRNVLLFGLVRLIILEKDRPGIFPGTDKYRIGMSGGFLWQRRDMQAAKTYIGSLRTVSIRELIRPEGRGDIHLNDDQIWFVIQIQGFHMLILKRDFVVGIEVGRQGCQP